VEEEGEREDLDGGSHLLGRDIGALMLVSACIDSYHLSLVYADPRVLCIYFLTSADSIERHRLKV
jgi:hypothetical protein